MSVNSDLRYPVRSGFSLAWLLAFNKDVRITYQLRFNTCQGVKTWQFEILVSALLMGGQNH